MIGLYDRNLLSVNENIKDMNFQMVIKTLTTFRVIAGFKYSRIEALRSKLRRIFDRKDFLFF